MLNKREDIGIWRSIQVSKLKELLRDVPGDFIMIASPTGNLVFMRGDPRDEDTWEEVLLLDVSDEVLSSFGGSMAEVG